MMEQCVEEFSADATRLALADAGDTLDDANFAIDTANASILALFVEEAWVREVIAARDAGGLRTGPDPAAAFFDAAFENEMNRLMASTTENFLKMMFRDGLKSGFYDFQIARDAYREWSGKTGIPMRQDLLFRFIEWQCIQLAPITPHWSEHVWELLGKDGLVIDASWPSPAPEDVAMTQSYAFLKETLRSFRLALLKAPKDETKARAYVTAGYMGAEKAALEALREIYTANSSSFPPNTLVLVKERLVAKEQYQKEVKNVMKFAALRQQEVKTLGADALEDSLAYDQKAILETNLDYITKSLGLAELSLHDPSDPAAPGPADKKKTSKPGKPSIFHYK